MRTILALAAERAWARILVLALGFGLFELVVGLSYASVDQNAIRQLVNALPPALRALAGSADIATPTGYAGSGYLHPVGAGAPRRRGRSRWPPRRRARPRTGSPSCCCRARCSRRAGWARTPSRWPAAWRSWSWAATSGGLAASALVNDLAPVDPGPLALALVGG